jgi:peptidyl-prolyl cis-trans isomerase B (cyclophilin B)
MKKLFNIIFVSAALAQIIMQALIPSAAYAGRYDNLLRNPEGVKKLAALADMEESRRIRGAALEPLLSDPDPLVRLRCAEVLGRIGDDAGIEYLERLLGDKDPRVVETAVYGLGLIGSDKATESLLGFVPGMPKGMKHRGVQALGITRNKNALEYLPKTRRSFHSSLRVEALLAVAAIGDSMGIDECRVALNDPQPPVVAAAVYALGRIGYKKAASEVFPFLESEDSELKMRTAEALGRFEHKKAIDPLKKMIDEQERLNIIKAAEALSRIGGNKSSRALVDFLKSDDVHVRTVALRGIAGEDDEECHEAVIPFLDDDSQMIRIAAIRAAAATDGDRARDRILEFLRAGTRLERMAAAEQLGIIGDERDLPLLVETLIGENDPLVREGAASGLGAWEDRDRLKEPLPMGGRQISPLDALVEAAGGTDWVVASISIESIGTTGFREQVAPLVKVFRDHNARVDSDRKLAVIDAIAKINEREGLDDEQKPGVISFLRNASMAPDPRVAAAAADAASAFDVALKPQPSGEWNRGTLPWGDPSLPLGERTMLLKTERGDIVIKLFGDDAPNIVNGIITLAEGGFYNGLTFHRVVPGFVIQGGCPRGDGWGDAGYFLRSQFNLYRYERGTVGMAHAGKDTPGSQFFIALSPQPHLDGRYTIVGKVTKGMDIADQIEVGDTFEVEVIR